MPSISPRNPPASGPTRLVLALAVATLIVLFLFFVWPSRYRYTEMRMNGDQYPVRIDRFTGEAEMLLPAGWTELSTTTGSTDAERFFGASASD